MVARLLWEQDAVGSSPTTSTKKVSLGKRSNPLPDMLLKREAFVWSVHARFRVSDGDAEAHGAAVAYIKNKQDCFNMILKG